MAVIPVLAETNCMTQMKASKGMLAKFVEEVALGC